MGRGETAARVLERSRAGAVLARIPTWRGVLVLGYHRIGRPGDGVHDMRLWSATADDFAEQVRFLTRQVEIVSGDELPEALGSRRGRRVALTFDDGYRDNYDTAYPVLRSHGVPAVFFVATGFLDRPRVAWWDEIAWMVRSSRRPVLEPGAWLTAPLACDRPGRDAAIRTLGAIYVRLPAERAGPFLEWLASATGSGRADAAAAASTWMTWDMVREMRAAGMTFGAHTVDHPVLARCSVERQRREIAGSVTRLHDELGQPPTLFSYPIGAPGTFDARTRACLREAGITHAFSLSGGYQRPGALDPLDIPREHVSPTRSPERFRAAVTMPRAFCRPAKQAAAPSPDPPRPVAGATACAAVWSGPWRRSGRARRSACCRCSCSPACWRPTEFGVVAAVAAYVALIELGSDIGMKPAVVYEQEEGLSERIQTAFTMNLATAVALCGLGVAFAPAVAGFFGVADHAGLFRLGALNLLLTGLGNVHDAVLLRDMSFARRIRPQIARDLVRVTVSVGLAVAGFGAAALVYGFLAGTAAWTAWQWILTPLRPRLRCRRTVARSMIAYGAFPHILGNNIDLPNTIIKISLKFCVKIFFLCKKTMIS